MSAGEGDGLDFFGVDFQSPFFHVIEYGIYVCLQVLRCVCRVPG